MIDSQVLASVSSNPGGGSPAAVKRDQSNLPVAGITSGRSPRQLSGSSPQDCRLLIRVERPTVTPYEKACWYTSLPPSKEFGVAVALAS